MYIRISFLRCTRHLKNVVSTSRVIFTFCSKRIATSRWSDNNHSQKIKRLKKTNNRKERTNTNKNLSKTLINLVTVKNKRLKTELKSYWQTDAKRQKNWKQKSENRNRKKTKSKELWNRLNELNGEFEKIRQSNKELKKMSVAVLQINCNNFLFFLNV